MTPSIMESVILSDIVLLNDVMRLRVVYILDLELKTLLLF